MAERLPYPVFDSPLTSLTEAPRLLGRRPGYQTAVDSYNKGLTLLLERGEILQQRRQNGEFSTLGLVTEKIDAGGTLTTAETTLMRDFRTLIDAGDAECGRRNVNIARHIEYFRDAEANGMTLGSQAEGMKLRYQSGDFHLVESEDHTLGRYSSIDRFVVPMSEGDRSFSFIDGAPVDGIIRELDRRIIELRERRDLSWFEKRSGLRGLRRDRDVLYTSSTTLIKDDSVLSHARIQYEAYLKNESPLLTEWEKPDWYKSELLLRDRRILTLQKGRNRLGCLPFILPIPFIIALPLLWPRTPAPVILPTPVIVNQDACYGVEGGKLRIEIFNRDEDADPSVRGANQREMFYINNGLNQRDFRPNSDEKLIAGVHRIEDNNPAYAEAYYATAEGDQIQTAQRFRGDEEPNPWIHEATDFSKDYAALASCLSPEQRDQIAKDIASQKQHLGF